MTKEELIDLFFSEYCDGICFDDLQAFAKLIAEKERERLADIAQKNGNDILAMQLRGEA